jgi:thiol-disulfide isomerase/thioredoxin
MLAICGSVLAQTPPAPAKPGDTGPATAPTAPANPVSGGKQGLVPNANIAAPPEQKLEIWPEARPLLEKEHNALRAMKAMTGVITSTWNYLVEGQQAVNTEQTMEFAIKKPDKAMLKSGDLTVFADGTNLVVYSASMKQFVRKPMPPLWSLRDAIEQATLGQIRTLPCEAILRPGINVEQSLRNVKTIERVREADFDGRPGQWVAGTAVDDRQPSTVPYTFERWYSNQDGLSYAVKQDWTAMYQEMATRHNTEQASADPNAKPPRVVNAKWMTTIKRRANAEVSDSVFVFEPGKDDRQVDALIFPRPNLKDQVALIGKPAPVVEGVDLDGQPVKLADHAGKVVVLDFWATWCGPCVQGLPHMETLKQQLGDKPVVIIGVNRDAPGTAAKVKKFLGKRGFTMAQIDDSTEGVARAFKVLGIPCTVIIDAKGVVQDVDVGYLPGKEREIAAKVEKVLSGQELRTAEELKRLREQVGAGE